MTKHLSSIKFTNSPSKPAKCGRPGCSTNVSSGMACDSCLNWFHTKCTGLSHAQFSFLQSSSFSFTCVSCIYQTSSFLSPLSPNPSVQPDISTCSANDPAPTSTFDSGMNVLLKDMTVLSSKVESSLSSSDSKLEACLTCLHELKASL